MEEAVPGHGERNTARISEARASARGSGRAFIAMRSERKQQHQQRGTRERWRETPPFADQRTRDAFLLRDQSLAGTGLRRWR